MSLFGSLMADVDDDPSFFGSHMRQMHQMNQMSSMMNSMFADPFGMFGGGSPLAIVGPRHGSSLMPFMPQMPSMNRLFADMNNPHMSAGSSYSSSTVVMSNGPNGKPQVISSTSSTKIGPNGVKETRKTLEDSRTGTKKMSIGHHIGERAHLIERAQNYYSGDREETQEFINLEEDEAEDFDREFQHRSGAYSTSRSRALAAAPLDPGAPAAPAARLAIMPAAETPPSRGSETGYHRPSSRRPLRGDASSRNPSSANVRSVYSASQPQRHRHRARASRHITNEQ